MDILVRIAQFLLSLCILVLLHELGHYVAARAFKARVEKFYIFFNPWFSLFKRKIGDTEFGIGWIPLGGFAKIAGMVDESFDTKSLVSEPKPYEFRAKPAWQRLIIVSGGVIVNLLLAWVIYSAILFTAGESYVATADVRYGIAPDSVGRAAGFLPGDMVQLVNGKPVERFSDLYTRLLLEPEAEVAVLREGQPVSVTVPRWAIKHLVQGQPFFGARMPFVVDSVAPGSAAAQAGYQRGDSLLSIDGQPATYFDEFREAALQHRNGAMHTVVMRAGVPTEVAVSVPETGLVGVYAVADYSRLFRISHREYGLMESIPAGARLGYRTLANYARSLKLLFMPNTGAQQSIGGFISIGKIFPGSWDWRAFWSLTAFLSVALALMNFLPIPGLDGGHAVFILYEMVTRRKPSAKFLIKAQTVGFILLMALLVYANANDIIKLFR